MWKALELDSEYYQVSNITKISVKIELLRKLEMSFWKREAKVKISEGKEKHGRLSYCYFTTTDSFLGLIADS